MKLLLTGASGFIGSHILEHVLINTDWDVACIASWKHKGTPERIEEVLSRDQSWKNRVNVITHDLESPITSRTAKRIGFPKYIINAAAESHVDRSITDPVPFVQNNVNVILNMLEFARTKRVANSLHAFIQVSTDEVYGAAPEGVNHSEWSPILPSNPYAASKACQEAIAISYWRTYGVPLIITNTMNNFGEMQDPEKYTAKVIRNVQRCTPVPVHGKKGDIGSRYYLHARNHADAILYLLRNVTPQMYKQGSLYPDRYNVVGDVELNNLEVAQKVADIIGKPLTYEFVNFHATRPGHDKRYALDGSKLKRLGWSAPNSFSDSLDRYVKWTLAHPQWL